MSRINKKILYPELSYKLTGIFFKTQKELGRFCRERQYCDKIEILLKEDSIPYKRELEIIKFKDDSPKGNKVDFLVNNKIILEIKAKNFITKDDYFQTLRYLEAAKLELGMIINFRSRHLKPKRILNSKVNYNK